MIRPRYLLDSNIAQKDSASAFSHSLDPKLSFGACELHFRNGWKIYCAVVLKTPFNDFGTH